MTAPLLHIDFETRSELDLREVGLYNYARHPSTDVWCMSWAVDDDEPQVWTPDSEGDFRKVFEFVYHGRSNDGHRIMAHNAPFEMAVWKEICIPRYRFPWPDSDAMWLCTMAQAYAMGLPGALEDAALALGLSVLKDTAGRALMLRYSKPWRTNPTKWMDECPEFTVGGEKYTGAIGLQRLHAYCQQDVRVERELGKRLMPLSEKERKVWMMDYRINQRGVAVDVETAKAAVSMAETVKARCDLELGKVTGNAVQTVTAVAALKDWMASKGVAVSGLAKQDVVDLLDTDLPDDVRRALALRQEAGKASLAKLDKMLANVDENGRLHNMYQYHGAQTGRWAGRAVQTHNLVRDMPPPATVEKVMTLIRAGNYEAIDMIYGPPLSMISRCLRSFFVAPDGKRIVGGDFSNVEGRGQAWFAGEDWKVKAFVAADNKTGPGLYELAYSRMFNVSVESVKNPSEERQVGKVCELAFGYQGGVGSFHVMAKTYGVKVSDAKADEFKNAWRAAHPKIKAVWKQIENAAIGAIVSPGTAFKCGHPGREATYKVVGSFLWCLLPSGRATCYPYPKLLDGQYGPMVTYMCVPSEQDKREGKIIDDPKNASNWARVSTYGGSLFNNIVQGFCRDLLADCMLALHEHGAPIVLHTHDDINVEVPNKTAERGRDFVKRVMMTVPAWAKGFPLVAKCSVMTRYGK